MSSTEPSKTSPFSFQPPPGGDITLQSSDGVVFVAHSAFLGLASPVFGGMFSTATKGDTVELAEDAESIALMLRFIYPPAFLNDLPLPLLAKSLHMARKYNIDGIITTLDYVISHSLNENSPLRLDPVHTFDLAVSYALRETQKTAAKSIQQLRDTEDVTKFAKLLPNHASIIGLLGAQCVRIRVLFDLLVNLDKSWIAPIAESGYDDIDYYSLLMCESCVNKLDQRLCLLSVITHPGSPLGGSWRFATS
jgi:hypothetical protein